MFGCSISQSTPIDGGILMRSLIPSLKLKYFHIMLFFLLILSACSSTDSSIKDDNVGVSPEPAVEETISVTLKSPAPTEAKRILRPEGNTIETRFDVPEGFERIPVEEGSFEGYLRNLPLKPDGSYVHYYDGGIKYKNVYSAVIDMDIGERDLQQCADAVMRLRAEYLFQKGLYDDIHFNFTNGFCASYSKWRQGYRISVKGNEARWIQTALVSNTYESFREYMDMVFAYAGTISLAQELKAVSVEDMKIGDVFIQAYPGHCVIVVDMAQNPETGEKLFMIAQSYMPAQDIQILKNYNDESISPWYSIDFGDVLDTPEWRFYKDDLKRFE